MRGARRRGARARGNLVGVDAEPAPAPHGDDAARRSDLSRVLGGPQRTAIRRWVRLEAVLKADGRGLRVDPSRVAFHGSTAHVDDDPAAFRISDRRIAGCLVSVAVGPAPR